MTRAVASLSVLLLAITGCSTEKKPDAPPRAVRFAVIAAPEIGTDDTDLALAVTKLSREPDLDFVLVPGPLLATDADQSALDLLKEDLGQIAPPVYVKFASVCSGTRSALKAEDILGALEKMGPGPEHAVAYSRTPSHAPRIVVDVVGPDGKDTLVERPEDGVVIAVGKAAANVSILVGDGVEVEARAGPELLVPALSRGKKFVIATFYRASGALDVQPVALEGPNPAPPPRIVIAEKHD